MSKPSGIRAPVVPALAPCKPIDDKCRTSVQENRRGGPAAAPRCRVGGFGFQFVCAGCLTTRGVLESPELPDVCPRCGLREPWTGPVARERFRPRLSTDLMDSPFYLAPTNEPVRPRRRPPGPD